MDYLNNLARNNICLKLCNKKTVVLAILLLQLKCCRLDLVSNIKKRKDYLLNICLIATITIKAVMEAIHF